MITTKMRVLVTVKAYPALSRRYGETVCVAGAQVDTELPRWIRLYPVSYRELPRDDRFQKYQLVDLEVSKASDGRPESYRPNLQSMRQGEVLPAGDWATRWHYLSPLAGATTACQLIKSQGTDHVTSLGMIKPTVQDLKVERNAEFSAEKVRHAEMTASEDLFGAVRSALEPAPYTLTYKYRCEDRGCRGHEQGLIDWEAGQAARAWKSRGADDAELPDMLRSKFLDEMCGPAKDTYFFLGNQHLRPKGFLVLGVFWPPVRSRPPEALF